jgi:hypothetical protein
VSAALHAAAYFVPGLLLTALAVLLGRGARAAVAAARGTAPRWARRLARLCVVLLGATGAALLGLAAVLAAIVLHAPP